MKGIVRQVDCLLELYRDARSPEHKIQQLGIQDQIACRLVPFVSQKKKYYCIYFAIELTFVIWI
jgi:hypothetical protein